jgi:hypothetical protein
MNSLLTAGGIGAVVLLIVNLAAGAQPLPKAVGPVPGTSVWCDLAANGALTGRASNSTAAPVLCTVNCIVRFAKGGVETFGCHNIQVKAKAQNVRICPKTAKASSIISQHGFCKNI